MDFQVLTLHEPDTVYVKLKFYDVLKINYFYYRLYIDTEFVHAGYIAQCILHLRSYCLNLPESIMKH